MAGVLDIADKYDLAGLRATLASRFEGDWPKSLSEWDQVEGIREAFENSRCFISRKTWPEDLLPEPVSAARLAIQLKNPSLLTAVFYDLYRCRNDVDWDSTPTKTCLPLTKGARWQIANAEIYQTLWRLQQLLETRSAADLHRTLGYSDNCSMCKSLDVCQNVYTKKFYTTVHEILLSRDPLKVFRELGCWAVSSGLCSYCKDVVMANSWAARRDTWEAIELLFQ